MKKTAITIAAVLVAVSLFAEIRAITHDDYGTVDAWQSEKKGRSLLI